MKKYGLIGERLGHSYSQILHGLLADYEYRLVALAPGELDGFLRGKELDGFNVTIPYKQAVIPYLAELGPTARRIGSVNTVVRRPDGSLWGENTDAYGFTRMAQSAGVDFRGRKTLVLGSGGTSLTARAVVEEAGGEAVVISRHGENDYQHLDAHRDATFLVNATPVGMYPRTGESPVDLSRLPRLEGVLDVIYNPLRTRLLQQARALGIPCADGLKMLVYQAARACELFTGEPVGEARARAAESSLRKATMNLTLVGMPGCGKTTVGRALQKLTKRPLIDVDQAIEKEAGSSIPEIFQREGEAGFRAREKEMLRRYGQETGRILVTGGGAVKDSENRAHLMLNGFVVHLTRPLEALSTGGRPLSTGREALERLWREREPLYRACADCQIANQTTPDECAGKIMEALDEALRA